MIHKSAIVGSGASIGADVTIGPFSVIEDGAVIGDRCVIGPHVTVMRHAKVGAGCRIHAGAVIGDLPQDLGFKGEDSFVSIGANCVLRECVTVHRGTKPGTMTEMGDGCFLMACAHVAHNVKMGSNVILANSVLLGGYAEVGDRAFISGNCLVHQFCRIGRLAMLGGGSGVSKDVPPFFTAKPLTVNRVVGVNVVGLRRSGASPDDRKEVRRAFKTLYRSGLNVSQAVAKLRAESASSFVTELCDFVDSSKRGICAAVTGGVEEDESE